jgi:nucleoside-diphosphate-sugar epimerase
VRVLVTGATGFIGLALVERLRARGDDVRALVRRTSRVAELQRAGAKLVTGDVVDARSLAPAVAECDRVIHLAGVVKALTPGDLFLANAQGTRNVAVACASAPNRPSLVYVSSQSAAGPAVGGRPRTEEDLPAPVSMYGESKLAGEEAVRDVGDRIRATIIRPPIVYGPRDKELMPQLLRMARAGVVVRVGPQKKYSLVHVADLCDGILAAADRGAPVRAGSTDGIYFLDDGVARTWDEIALAACTAAGKHARIVVLPEATTTLVAAGASVFSLLTRTPAMLSFDKMREIKQAAWTCSSARALRELDWTPRVQLAAGMADAVAWFRANPCA